MTPSSGKASTASWTASTGPREPDGFFEPIPKSEFGTREYPNYVRVWMNYGLKAASLIGNKRALPLMRDMQTWFSHCDERFMAKHLVLAFQGVISNTTVYLSDVGIPEDLETVVNYYQEDWWLGQLIQRDQGAIHKRPTPHGTELEGITAYMDMYMATGKAYYLNAVTAAYDMFKDKWQHVGGGIVAIEHTDIAPGCYWLDPVHKYNELCCSAHWLYLNQRFHRLNPEVESYVGEIEKTLYNVVVANQIGDRFIRYHAFIDIQKDGSLPTPVSCCAGLGTRILGSLPEYLYSIADDGIYVDIYSDSTVSWQCRGAECRLATRTEQPVGGATTVEVTKAAASPFAIRLRIPAWATADVSILVNGTQAATGKPGSYCTLERRWRDGDKITFTLPMGFHVTEYVGLDTLAGHGRYAYERGPLLLGLVGNLDWRGKYVRVSQDPAKPESWLLPVDGQPCHYAVKDKPGYEWMPYHEIENQVFTCYPVFPERKP